MNFEQLALGVGAEWSFHDAMTLAEAKALLRERVFFGDGLLCPCCSQRAKVYRRRVHATLAVAAIAIYRAGGTRLFVHNASLPGDTHESSQLSWWGLIEEERVRRPDGGRAGWWRTTSLGADFVGGQATIPKYVLIYDACVRGFEGAQVTIHDCLGEKFNYRELMGLQEEE